MPVKKNISVEDLLKELHETIATKGLEGTIALLRNGRETVSDNTNIQFVVVTVCNHFSISVDQLMNEKNDKTKYAKGFVIYYLRTVFFIPWNEIKLLLKHRDKTWLWELMKLIKELKPRLSSDTEWLMAKKIFDQLIKEYKLQK